MTESKLIVPAGEEASKILMPTEEGIKKWLLESKRHSFHYEYFIYRLGLNSSDPERPHDLVGPGNKLEWELLRRFSLQYSYPVDFEIHILPAIKLHKQQYHHQVWDGRIEPVTEDDMKAVGVDAVCYLMEDREYEERRASSYDDIPNICYGNKKQKHYINLASKEMAKIEQPDLESITLFSFPNIGIPEEMYNTIRKIFSETVKMLKNKGYEMSLVTR